MSRNGLKAIERTRAVSQHMMSTSATGAQAQTPAEEEEVCASPFRLLLTMTKPFLLGYSQIYFEQRTAAVRAEPALEAERSEPGHAQFA